MMGLFSGTKRSKNSKTKPSKKKGSSDNITTVEEVTKTKKPKPKGSRDGVEQEQSSALSQQRKKKSKDSKKNKSPGGATAAATADKLLKEKLSATSPDVLATPPAPKNTTTTTLCDDDAPTQPTCPPTAFMVTNLSKETTPPPSKEPANVPLPPSIAPSRETLSSKAPGESLKSAGTQQTTSVTSATEKWVAEPTAKAWMEKADFSKTKTEYEKLQKMMVNVEKDCKKWKAFPKLNQSEDYPVPDASLIKLADKDYVNISRVEVPLHRSILIGQIPTKGSEELFWKTFYDQHVTYMTILNEDLVDFFPKASGEYIHYGGMFVNNRRVESIGDDVVRFVIEVLPSGCSNSIMANITVIKNWNLDSVHSKFAVVMKEILELSTFFGNSPVEENALIMSKHGVGRAGYFVSLAVAVQKMDQKTEPQIYEIVKGIRSQRPKAVETITQYASLYLAMFYYIKRKVTKSGEIGGEKKPSSDPGDPLCKKAVELTRQFTSALMAEVAANAGRSTMTMITK